jgi:hypothetical protein
MLKYSPIHISATHANIVKRNMHTHFTNSQFLNVHGYSTSANTGGHRHIVWNGQVQRPGSCVPAHDPSKTQTPATMDKRRGPPPCARRRYGCSPLPLRPTRSAGGVGWPYDTPADWWPCTAGLPQRRMLVQHKATTELAGCPQRAKWHACAKLSGGGARYLGTRDWHRGSGKLELWVCKILLGPLHKAR